MRTGHRPGVLGLRARGHWTRENRGLRGRRLHRLDTTDYEAWLYLDLESRELVDITGPLTSDGWDLAFQRYTVKLNGGVSGGGEVEAAELLGQTLEDLVQAPVDGWVTDAADADEDGVPEYALATWYDYDSATHLLSAADKSYALRSVEGGYFALQFDSYYDDAGSPGHVSFRVSSVASP
ncbi:MAG: hypothetical protein GY913_16465 [Proteobacteria bacterium]|nr:hypothetical protein [Pseudomonadota bacterium]